VTLLRAHDTGSDCSRSGGRATSFDPRPHLDGPVERCEGRSTVARSHSAGSGGGGPLGIDTGARPETTKTSANAATVLYPLRRGRVGNVMQGACALACVQAHVWHHLPPPLIPPMSCFRPLETGRVGERLTPPGEAFVSTPGPPLPTDATEPAP
jgi:hypothetical protein